MALNIAAMQQLATPVTSYLEGQAMRQQQEMNERRMTALEAAEGRAQESHEVEMRAAEYKFDEMNGKRTLAKVQHVMSLPKEQRKAYVQEYEPEFVSRFEEQRGESWADIDDDEIEEMGGFLLNKISGDLGISPAQPEEYTLGKGDKRMRGDKVIAENTQAEEDEWTKPEAVMIGGKKVMAQFNNTKGTFRVVDGVSPIDEDGKESDKLRFDQADKLRDEYNTQSKEFVVVGDAYQRVKQSAKDPSAAGDLALLFSYMKILDPNSVVREQEFANAQNAGGVPDRIRAQYNKVLSGERLSQNQRADFITRARELYKGQADRHERTVKGRYTKLATDLGVDPKYVVSDLGVPDDEPSGPPKVTTDAEFDALPSGTVFIDPDGKQRKKP